MNKNCFDTQEGKSCKFMETRKDPIEKFDCVCAYCTKHNLRCIDVAYRCKDYIEDKENGLD